MCYLRWFVARSLLTLRVLLCYVSGQLVVMEFEYVEWRMILHVRVQKVGWALLAQVGRHLVMGGLG